MKLRVAASREGWVWTRNAFLIFLRRPLAFASVFAACLFAFMLLGLVPVVGTVVLLILPPTGSLVFMMATRLALAGKAPMPIAFAELAAAGRPRLLELLKLGLTYAAATFLVFWISSLVDGGALEALLDSLPDPKTTPEVTATRLGDPRLQAGLMLRLTLAGLLSVPYWHAPALTHWGRLGWLKALFFSSVAIWRNKAAFLVYGLAWAAAWMLLLTVISVSAGLFGQARMALIATPLTLVFSTVFYTSLWFTFAGCFQFGDDAEAAARAA